MKTIYILFMLNFRFLTIEYRFIAIDIDLTSVGDDVMIMNLNNKINFEWDIEKGEQ